MNIQDLKNHKMLLLDCISGSKAYGLATAQSDTDLKGVFLLPKNSYFGLQYTEQVNNETNDEVYYELKRFVDLLAKNNPNILELLSTPADCILYKNPIMDLLKQELFLSKLCQHTFAGYAQTQIKKAKGLNKKIVNPVDEERKSVLDFCFVVHGQGSIALSKWLEKNNYDQKDCGLVNINHMREIYAVYHNSQLSNGHLKGICSGVNANDISLSSVEKGIEPLGILSYNKDGYSSYCKDYKEYWDWVEKRNDARYQNTLDHGKNYDAKNMMHTFRLLNMAEEIATEGRIIVRRNDRESLLQIRSGIFSYEELVERANEKVMKIEDLYKKSGLPDAPDLFKVESVLIYMRDELYKNS